MPNLPTTYLKLGSNRILPDCTAGATETALWLFLKNMTLSDIAAIVFNPEELNHIESHYGNLRSSFEGYTEVRGIMNRESVVEVMLAGGHVTEEDVKDEGDLAGDGSDELPDGDGSASGDLHPEREAE